MLSTPFTLFDFNLSKEVYPVSILPLAWSTVKTLVTLIPGEVNVAAVLAIVAEVELNGGSYDRIFAAIIEKNATVFPDPVFRPIALFILTELQKVAGAMPTPKA